MKYVLLIVMVLLLAGCTEQALEDPSNTTQNKTIQVDKVLEPIPVEPNITQNITTNINGNMTNDTENITINISQNITSNISANITENISETKNILESKSSNSNIASSYSGNPLNLFKSDTIIIFGDSGALVAATINLQSYIGTAEYKLDDNGELPSKNVILLGDCTNSYIAKLMSCTTDDITHLKLLKKDDYILIIESNKPSAIVNAVNQMIKPSFKMRETIP